MEELLQLIKNDRRPALGVTEPAAIALACAAARELSDEEPERVELLENSGMYKNAFTCGLPGTTEVGNLYAAALGVLAGRADRGLLALADITPLDVERSRRFVAEGRVTAGVSAVSSDIHILARVYTAHDVCEAEIRGSHTNICRKVKNGAVLWEKEAAAAGAAESLSPITGYTLADFYRCAEETPAAELAFLGESWRMNLELAEAARRAERCVLTKSLLAANGGAFISADLRASARAVTGAAAEGRVLGLDKPAMSITGSGNHGIIATLPLYALQQTAGLPEELLWRGIALSYLVTMYMKEYSGKLSAFCGCGIAAGTGMACGLTLMQGGDLAQVTAALNNMAASLVGMICTGGNHACCMKVLAAVDTAISSSQLALAGSCVSPEHGVGGRTPEETMRNIGRIAVPGMVETERVILDIMQEKDNR
ncbi:MAG: serine dehydratase subunit alpha family protein [Firmicutes bacterium]|nr:serine dehydratase subunit alpha family protein [Bacillota bacterium]